MGSSKIINDNKTSSQQYFNKKRSLFHTALSSHLFSLCETHHFALFKYLTLDLDYAMSYFLPTVAAKHEFPVIHCRDVFLS